MSQIAAPRTVSPLAQLENGDDSLLGAYMNCPPSPSDVNSRFSSNDATATAAATANDSTMRRSRSSKSVGVPFTDTMGIAAVLTAANVRGQAAARFGHPPA